MSGYDEMRQLVPQINRNKQLMPCPFCGQEVYLRMGEYNAHGKRPRFFINHKTGRAPKGCPYHRSSNNLTFVDPRQALNEWNRRY